MKAMKERRIAQKHSRKPLTPVTQIATAGAGPAVADGLLRLVDIVGRDEVTVQEAAKNRKKKKGPRRPKPAVRGIMRIKKSSWWKGIRDGLFPAPIKIGGATAWRVSEINSLLERLGSAP